MKIFITGATSLLGGGLMHAARAAGHQVIACARRNTAALHRGADTLVRRDILDVTAADLSGIDAAVHFATGSDGDEAHILRVAVEGTLALYRASREAGVKRFVHVSSMSVYPGPLRADPARVGGQGLELHPEKRGVYAMSKTMADVALQDALKREPAPGMEVVILRPGLVFGAGMKGALAGTAVALPLGLMAGFGGRKQVVPLVHNDDLGEGLVALLETAAEAGKVQCFEVLSGTPPTKEAFLRVYRNVTGQPCRQFWIPRWVLMPLGWTLDGLLGLRGGPRHVAYKIDRLFRFDAAALPHAAFWQAIGRAPRRDTRKALIDTLTPDRDPPPAPDAEDALKARAGALGRVVIARRATGSRVGIVLVGAGRIVDEMHVPAIKGLDGVEVRAVVDPVRALAERVAAAFSGAKAVEDITALDDSTLNGATAVIATPGHNHVALGEALLARGASLLIEKPVALDAGEFDRLRAAARVHHRPVSVIKNYRLRPNTIRLWRFLEEHDVGAPVAARVTFHGPPLATERARWMMEERRHRVLALELGIHFTDIACVVGGALQSLDRVHAVTSTDGDATLTLSAAGRMASGAELTLDFDLTGTANRTQIVLEFERCACILDFFPEGFRVLPRSNTPIDDFGAAAVRLGGFAASKFRPTSNGVPKRALPHMYIYRRHLKVTSGEGGDNPFSLDGVADTMSTLYMLSDRAYPPLAGGQG